MTREEEKLNERMFELGELDDLRKALHLIEQNINRASRTLAMVLEGVEAKYHEEALKAEKEFGIGMQPSTTNRKEKR